MPKLFLVQLGTEPGLPLRSTGLFLLFVLLGFLVLGQVSHQELWLAAVALGSWRLGIPAYRSFVATRALLEDLATPLSSWEVLWGYLAVFTGIYGSIFVGTGLVLGSHTGWSLRLLAGVLVGLTGVVWLAVGASRKVAPFWSFALLAVVEGAASFLV